MRYVSVKNRPRTMRSPFRGLESFRPEDGEFFFGREALTRKLIRRIQSHSFLAVLGASGSGKLSLVMAGLIPALGSEYVILRPGTDPLGALESAKEKALIVVDQFEELFTLTRDEAVWKAFIAKLLAAAKITRIVLTLRSDFLGEVGHIAHGAKKFKYYYCRNLITQIRNYSLNCPICDDGKRGGTSPSGSRLKK